VHHTSAVALGILGLHCFVCGVHNLPATTEIMLKEESEEPDRVQKSTSLVHPGRVPDSCGNFRTIFVHLLVPRRMSHV
jgi:hypothetical protein